VLLLLFCASVSCLPVAGGLLVRPESRMRKVSRMPEHPARAWTKGHGKTGVQLYRVLCHHHTTARLKGLLGHLAGER
jgi:hypothetical protein